MAYLSWKKNYFNHCWNCNRAPVGSESFHCILYRLSAEQVADFYRIFAGFFHDSVELKDILSKFPIFIMHYLSVYSNVFKKCALKVALAIHFAFEMSIES